VRYKRYLTDGYDGLADQPHRRHSGWNQLPPAQRSRVIELALERPDLSCRELACYIVDYEGCRAAGAVCLGIERLPYPQEAGISDHTSFSIDRSG